MVPGIQQAVQSGRPDVPGYVRQGSERNLKPAGPSKGQYISDDNGKLARADSARSPAGPLGPSEARLGAGDEDESRDGHSVPVKLGQIVGAYQQGGYTREQATQAVRGYLTTALRQGYSHDPAVTLLHTRVCAPQATIVASQTRALAPQGRTVASQGRAPPGRPVAQRHPEPGDDSDGDEDDDDDEDDEDDEDDDDESEEGSD
ncbi:hypothetical protein LTR36_004935 [Oleoguttula mirabilis]|uniref:Uncharacterized protein n=1 Tax=Oleoguttula mirabilis TaxID=1507867 RepID=A0AAV9JVQ9_9PEZI|nr:hypothetical protein LTR36_004935 [Oleoguttula mirabilis]